MKQRAFSAHATVACVLAAAVAILAATVPVVAEDTVYPAGEATFTLVVGQSRILQVSEVVRVAVADPGVAEVVVVSKTEVLVNGKSEGRTTLHVWDSSGHTGYDVRVYKVDSLAELPKSEPVSTDPDVALRDAITAAVQEPDVRVAVVKGTVLLDGHVSTEHAKLRAETVAKLYASNVESIISVVDASASPIPPPPAAPASQPEPEPEPEPAQPPVPPEPRMEDVVAEYIGIPTVRVRSVGGKLLLEGFVESQTELERAQKIAGMFAADVVNLLEMNDPLQVLLKVEVVEVNSGALGDLGVTWAGMNGESTDPGSFIFGEVPLPVTSPLLPETPGAQEWQARLPVSSIVTEIWRLSPVRAIVDFLIGQDKAKVLTAPSLLTLSGKQASFLVGGEIPVYTGLTEGRITFEWREYGVKLNVLPTVDARDRIVLDVQPEVSALDWGNALDIGGVRIPALKVRRASTHLVLADGAVIVIGGLIQSIDVEVVKKLPILGDLPVIGALFRSKSFERGETELVIFITPKIVRAVDGVSRDMILELPGSGAEGDHGRT